LLELGGIEMDDGARLKLIEIAHGLAVKSLDRDHLEEREDEGELLLLARFRLFYRHLAVTVDLASEGSQAANARRAETADDLDAWANREE
jgi:hypothetical protein